MFLFALYFFFLHTHKNCEKMCLSFKHQKKFTCLDYGELKVSFLHRLFSIFSIYFSHQFYMNKYIYFYRFLRSYLEASRKRLKFFPSLVFQSSNISIKTTFHYLKFPTEKHLNGAPFPSMTRSYFSFTKRETRRT